MRVDLQQMLYYYKSTLYRLRNTYETIYRTANDDGVRLSRFVQSVTRDFPTSLLYKSFRNKRVKVNGKKAAPEYRLQAGDLIELYINDEFFPPEGAKPAVPKAAPKKKQNQPKVTVIYEDENIAVLYKPTHLLCHSDRTGDANLVDAFTQGRIHLFRPDTG